MANNYEDQEPKDNHSIQQQYARALDNALRFPHIQERSESVLDILAVLGSPLITLATLSVIVRARLNNEDLPSYNVGNLFYASPVEHNLGRCKNFNKFSPATDELAECWAEVEDAVRLLVRAREKGIPGLSSLENENELNSAFWESAVSSPELRMVSRDAYLAAIGKSLWLLDQSALESMRVLSTDYGGYEEIIFLKKRLNFVLEWLAENLHPEQISKFPALVDYAAELLIQERIDTLDDDTIYLECPVDYFLKSDLQYGIRAVCCAYADYRNHNADLLGDGLFSLGEISAVERILKNLAENEQEPKCRVAATELLEEYFQDT